jgi:glycosyltransferase involved in cell wall biosynthesis
MIIWLASYPRSGNTYLRLLLRHFYGLSTYSLYQDEQVSARAKVRELVGLLPKPKPLTDMAVAEEIYLVKTHELPQDDFPALYLVRDGRDTLLSYTWYILTFEHPQADVNPHTFRKTLHNLIVNEEYFGGWGHHVLAWTRRHAPTVLVKFENVIHWADPLSSVRQALNRVGYPLPKEITTTVPPTFAELHQIHPKFFRKGQIGEWQTEMPTELQKLFLEKHGKAMHEMGYTSHLKFPSRRKACCENSQERPMKQPSIFITARFRTGSTMLWNIFRQIPEVATYYEPLHERLLYWIASGVQPQSRHDNVDSYFKEYPPVEALRQYHSTEFGVCRLYLDARAQHASLKAYIQYLLSVAEPGKTSVLQFNRLDFRLSWVKANFPHVPTIHLYRSPREQWYSSIAQYPHDVEGNLDADPYLITTWARDLCQQFPFLASPYIRHIYQRHYYLWKLSYLAGSRLADISVSYESILKEPEVTTARLLQLAGLDVQSHLQKCLAVIVPKSLERWKQSHHEEWLEALEQECETTLTNLGLNQDFGKKPLAKIIAENDDYRGFVEDSRGLTWAIHHAQVACITQEIVAEKKEQVIQEKEQVIQRIHALAKERLHIIHYLESFPLRLFLKRYLPDCLQNKIRQIRGRLQPKLGHFHQYRPISLKTPSHYQATTASTPQCLPVVSIVTPSFNQAQFLERAIKSVLDQHYPKLEYIIQDGASTDGTKQILEKYRPRFTHLASYQDIGQANAVNLGFRHTTGEIMAWLNSDDMLLPGTIDYIARFFRNHPEIDVVYGHRIVINESDQEIGRWVLPPHEDNILLWADYIPQETLFWRRRIWEKVGGYVDESFHFALDWELLLRFYDARAKFVRLPRFLAAFRVHSDQKTFQKLEQLGLQEMSRLRKRIHGYEVSNLEACYQIRQYMRRHIIYDHLYRLGILRY